MRVHRSRPRDVVGDAGDARAGECEGGALGGEGDEPVKDWVSAELIGGEIAYEGAGTSWLWTWSEDGGCQRVSLPPGKA